MDLDCYVLNVGVSAITTPRATSQILMVSCFDLQGLKDSHRKKSPHWSESFCGSYTYQDVMESMLRVTDSLCGHSPLFPSEMGGYSLLSYA